MSAIDMNTLKGIGPKSIEMLTKAGINSESQLRKLGSIGAYILVKQQEPRASLNLLWGLEAALTGEAWQKVARERRLELLMALEDAMREQQLKVVE